MTINQERPLASSRTLAPSYASLLVHAEPSPAGSHRVAAAAALARDLDAHLIGLGAETFEAIPDSGGVYGTGEWLVLLQEQVNNDLQAAERIFRREAEGVDYEWRSAQDYPNRAMARAARAADLLVASPCSRTAASSSVDPAELVMSAGRPVLLAPDGGRPLQAKAIVVAWNDSREARRGVAARGAVAHARSAEVPDVLRQAAEEASADLIVAGGYGHSRAREWAFGGVTYELLHRPACCVLFSH